MAKNEMCVGDISNVLSITKSAIKETNKAIICVGGGSCDEKISIASHVLADGMNVMGGMAIKFVEEW